MKKIFCIVLACIMLSGLISVFPVSAAQTPEGSAVSSEAQFLAMSAGEKYYLSRDITITSPYAATFSGTFVGNGHKIILMGASATTVFTSVSGTVKNLTVDGNINISSARNIGAVALNANGKLENVTSNVNIMVSNFGTYA